MAFYVINKYADNNRTFDNATSAAAYFLGRSISRYIVVKSDLDGDRIVKTNDLNDVKVLEARMDRA